MPSESVPVENARSRSCQTDGVRTRIRLRFRKEGELRLVSHHDLLRCFERLLRRAAIPFCLTAGYNPRPRLSFASALPLGVIGCAEVVEVELQAPWDPEEVRNRLARHAPAGLVILSARSVDWRTTAQVQEAWYYFPVPAERRPGLPERLAELLAATEVWVERTRPQHRRLNIRPYLRSLALHADGLHFQVRVTPTGTARPEDVLSSLGLADLLAAGGILQRTNLLLADEVFPLAGGTPP